MPTIRFVKGQAPLEVPMGANLMKALTDAGHPVASTCGGDAVCARCGVIIVSGGENLSPESERERFIKEQNQIKADRRISCQTQIFGDIVVDTTYW